MAIELTRDQHAEQQLHDPSFREQWQYLYTQCPWATPFQSLAFVTAWYAVYREHYNPVLLCQFSADGTLEGFLPLAISRDAARLVVAGAHQAEYQVWLATVEHGNSFIESAITVLHQNFPPQPLVFTYLPPGSPVDWVAPEQRYGDQCVLDVHRRPLMQIGDGSACTESLRKKSNKSRLNRLKRLGELRFERITSATALEPLLEKIMVCYDFRQGAMHNSYPFQQDPLKNAFCLALMQSPEIFHVTVLKAGEVIAAAHLGVCSAHTVHVGIFVYDPFCAEHSPGKFHILMLGQMMATEQRTTLDLTPGGDPWKERFATDHDEVHVLSVFPNPAAVNRIHRQRKLATTAKQLLHSVGITPQTLRSGVTQLKKLTTWEGLAQLWAAPEIRIYSLVIQGVQPKQPSRDVRQNALDDLLAFPATATALQRGEFMQQSLNRIEHGAQVYTITDGKTLTASAWVHGPKEKVFLMELDQMFDVPEQAICVFDVAVHSSTDKDELYVALMSQIIRDIQARPGIQRVIVAVAAANKRLRNSVETLGAHYENSLFRRPAAETTASEETKEPTEPETRGDS